MAEEFEQVRVSELVDIEFDLGEGEAIARLLIKSRRDEQLAVELPFQMWRQVAETFVAGLKEFPGGNLRQ